jgi:PAS domain S-box-containing protein
VTHPQKPLILTHRDVDGVCAGAIAKASYPKAEIKFANPPDFVSMLNSLFRYDCVIILDLGIDSIQKNEAIEAFQKLSKTSSIVYIDHHIRPSGLTDRNLACKEAYRTDASTSELAWEFFKPAASLDYIAVLGAIGDYKERTPQIQGLLERYDERKVYPEALFLEWALMVSEDSFKRGVIEELVQGKWPYQMSIMDKEADAIVRRQRTLERYVREKAEKICEHVMLIRDPPFKATGPAATLLTKLDNVDIGIASRTDENHVYLSLRRHEESDINLASLIDKSASKFGGMGGGHLAASGGKIPVERFDEFLLEIGRILPQRRLKRKNKLDAGSVDKKKIERKLFKEIIEHRRAEERAEKIREYFQLQVDRMPIGSIVWDRDFRVKTWNPAATKIFGFTKEEALGKHPYEFIVPKEAQLSVDDVWRRLLKGDLTAHSVNENVTKYGRTIICDWANTPLKEADGTVIGVLSMVQDVTERRLAEVRLHESEEKFRNLAENSPNMIFINKGSRVVYANTRCEELMGYKREEFYSPDFDFLILIAPECINSLKKSFRKHGEGKDVAPYEYTLITKEGKRIEAILTTKLIQYEGERAILGTVTDITEHKKAEFKIRSEREVYRSIARAANRSRTVEELCELALTGIQKVIKYDLADVMVYHKSENALSSVAQLGFPRDLYERTVKWLDLKDGSKVAAQAALKKKGIYIDDMKTSKLMSRLHDLIVKYDISTMYSVPLFSRGKLQGVLEVITVGDKVLSKDDCEVLNTISEELAGGITKAKSEEHLVTVKEAFGWLGMPTNRAPSPNPHL